MEAYVDLWGIIISIVAPFVVSLLVRKSYKEWVKVLIAFVLAAIIAVGSLYFAGKLSTGVAPFIVLCFGTGQVVFWAVIEQIPGLKDWLVSKFNADPLPN